MKGYDVSGNLFIRYKLFTCFEGCWPSKAGKQQEIFVAFPSLFPGFKLNANVKQNCEHYYISKQEDLRFHKQLWVEIYRKIVNSIGCVSYANCEQKNSRHSFKTIRHRQMLNIIYAFIWAILNIRLWTLWIDIVLKIKTLAFFCSIISTLA